MNPQMVVPYWQDRSPEDGILFVRTKGILTTMVRAPLVAVGLIVMAISMPIQSTFGTIRTLELIVYPDGTTKKITETIVKQEQITEKSLDVETIFELRPELRDDDKQLVSFISANGGQAYESELRKKFLQPRTTMWRAVKRLERYGIVEIDKKELQNLVRLKKKLEDEN